MTTDEAVAIIAGVKQSGLNELDLSNCIFNEVLWEELRLVGSKITNLTLANCGIGTENAKLVADYCPNLQYLAIGNEPRNYSLVEWGKLSPDSINHIGNEGAIAIAGKLKKLTYLDISYNSVGVPGLTAIASELTLLETLIVCPHSDIGIGTEGISSGCPNLRKIAVRLPYNILEEPGIFAKP